jgi:hypothetical protein
VVVGVVTRVRGCKSCCWAMFVGGTDRDKIR